MRGRHRPYYLAKDYEREVTAKGKCQLDGPGPYQPLFRIIDFPSLGFRIACQSWITERVLHLMSHVEFDGVLYLHSRGNVVQIYEQVALNPAETQTIARKLGVKHPATGDDDIVMSTDLLVTTQDGGLQKRRAIAVKRERDLTPRVLEKLSIEREYWSARSIEWTLLLDTMLPKIVVQNMRVLFDWHDPANLPCDETTTRLVQAWLTPYVQSRTVALNTMCQRCDRQLLLQPGTALAVTYHSIIRRIYPVDITKPLHPFPEFSATESNVNA